MTIRRPLALALWPMDDPRMAFEARIIAQRIGGDRRLTIRSADKCREIMNALLQPLPSSQDTAAAVAVDAGGLLGRVKSRQRLRIRLSLLPKVSQLWFGVAGGTKSVLIFQPQREPQASQGKDAAPDDGQDNSKQQSVHIWSMGEAAPHQTYTCLPVIASTDLCLSLTRTSTRRSDGGWPPGWPDSSQKTGQWQQRIQPRAAPSPNPPTS